MRDDAMPDSTTPDGTTPDDETPDDDVSWDGLGRGQKALAAVAGAGVGLMAAGAVGVFLLIVVLATVAAFPGAIELDGMGAVFWAVLFAVPCALVSSAVLFPFRVLLRNTLGGEGPRATAVDYAVGWFRTFLTVALVLECTPGVHAHSLWPAVCVATLDALLEAGLRRRRPADH
ncbi:hypothetical protein [Streptomyces sp. NPDC054794]